MKVFIIYKKYLYENDTKPVIGGIQNYIENLSLLISKLNVEVNIIQHSSFSFIKEINKGIYVHGVISKTIKQLCSYSEKIADFNKDLIIFATSTNTRKTKFINSVAIQHGIYWDSTLIRGKKIIFPVDILFRFFHSIIEIYKQSLLSTIISVDYNYINWYRSVTTSRKLDYKTIANFSRCIDRSYNEESEVIKIIFARRLEKLRGTDLLMSVLPRLLKKYSNLKLLVAGDGSQKEKVLSVFKDFQNFEYIRYKPSESLTVHSTCDIAIIPTLASEGTSFSLLEAMGAGCAVVTTDVGGLSNVVLNKFNGLIISPSEENLYESLCYLVENKKIRILLGKNAQDTIKTSFSFENWSNSWEQIILSFFKS